MEGRFHTKYVWDELTDCMIWIAGTDGRGYGAFWINGGMKKAHRVSYGWFCGSIQHHIDHVCNNRLCVNPDHLEDVTQQENNIRMYNRRSRRSHCKYGHLFDEGNSYTLRNKLECRTCRRVAQMRFRSRHDN